MPSRNHIMADPEGVRNGGRHFEGDLAARITQIRSALLASLASNEQPDAYDDEAGTAFNKVYDPARKDMLTLLESLEAAFRQAYEQIDATALNLAKVEDFNIVSATALANAVQKAR
ncbi:MULTISPECIES: hypothetical protein [Streptomyces]|uniref:PE domain-containing protein n=2 Tax=Streptomyces TaxID=1883 RepID=A0ABV9J7B5_9ACTN